MQQRTILSCCNLPEFLLDTLVKADRCIQSYSKEWPLFCVSILKQLESILRIEEISYKRKIGLSFTLSLPSEVEFVFHKISYLSLVVFVDCCNYLKYVEGHPSWAAILFLVFFEVWTSKLTDACRVISFVVASNANGKYTWETYLDKRPQ